MPLYNNTLICDCTRPDGVCHVLKIFLKGQDLAGVLPPAIVKLPYLKTLDLTRNYLSGNIPPEWASSKLEYLSLVVNRLKGNIPSYLGEMTSLTYLNLENNLFYGSVPPELGHLVNMVNLILCANNLTGELPLTLSKMTKLKELEIDLSYNNFTESSLPPTCQETLNFFKSTSRVNDSKPIECLNSLACSEDRYSVHINCGGRATTIGSISYEADEKVEAAAKYIPYRKTWEISTTGLFWDKNRSASDYIPQNLSTLRMSNSQLYTRARASPLSLTYYVRCLGNGNYTVKLHFAEIVLRDNSSFYSLGRRIFDVYIQEKRVWKDFSIVNEAQGVDKVVIKDFKVSVMDGTTEIRFQWTGKGTTAVPSRGTYGPIISAIDVESGFKPPNSGGGKQKKLIVAGAVIFPVLLILIIACIIWWKVHKREVKDQELLGLDLQTGVFIYRKIKAAANNFDLANKIGQGGFGAVYDSTRELYQMALLLP